MIVLVIASIPTLFFAQNIRSLRKTLQQPDQHLNDPSKLLFWRQNTIGRRQSARDQHIETGGAFQGRTTCYLKESCSIPLRKLAVTFRDIQGDAC